MASPLSVGLVKFPEAIKAIRDRGIVLPDAYYGKLQGMARQLAFSVAGLASVDQLQSVLDSLTKALENGETFGAWKNRVLKVRYIEPPPIPPRKYLSHQYSKRF